MSASNQAIQLARKEIVSLLEKQKAQITMALPKHLSADRLCRVAVTEMSKNPKLFECNSTSVLAAIITGAQLGLEFGVDGQAYLIPYKGQCQFVPGWKGYVDLISRAGRASVWTGAVRQGDDFDYDMGDKPFVTHKPGDDDVSEFVKVYAIGRINGAQWPVVEVWSRNRVLSHLKQYNKVGSMHYATQNENNLEMYGRKVALLQVVKYMPKSIELQRAQELEYSANDRSEPGRHRANSSRSTPKAGCVGRLADNNDNGQREARGCLSQAGMYGINGNNEPSARYASPGPTNGFWRDADWLRCRDGKWRPVESRTFPLATGSPERVGRLRGYGNAINAQVAKAFIESYLEANSE